MNYLFSDNSCSESSRFVIPPSRWTNQGNTGVQDQVNHGVGNAPIEGISVFSDRHRRHETDLPVHAESRKTVVLLTLEWLPYTGTWLPANGFISQRVKTAYAAQGQEAKTAGTSRILVGRRSVIAPRPVNHWP